MICITCGKKIPKQININGYWKQTSSSRKKCFNCVPFGQKLPKKTGSNCTCSCGRTYYYDRSKGGTLKECNSCSQSKRRKKLKHEFINLKGGKCSNCGYNSCNEALEFHHINKEEKELNISTSWNNSRKILEKELGKCVLLCANCHREFHSGLITLKESTVPLLYGGYT